MLVVFGGAFNPPTIAHYEIAKCLNKAVFCDQLFFLPVGNQYPKKNLIESFHRIKMLKLVCQQLDSAAVCEIEINSDQVLTTYETLTLLKKQDPQKEISFVIGADNLKQLNTWSQFKELLNHFKLIIFKRNDLDVEAVINQEFQAYKNRFIILDSFGEMDVSSSLYRENIKNEHLVLKSVSDYIKRNNLYGRH